METAKALEGISNPGKFELIATSVLRKQNKDYAAIIHTGINVKGKPINSPVDGFCLVPRSDPPRFLLVEHTTTDRDGLQNKWLSILEGKEGDLIKASRKAEDIRKSFPNAKFTVILTTNKRLNNIDFLKKVYKKADDEGIDVDIWEQSRLVSFLDDTDEGHWIRKEYLGIEVERLSESLLYDLCQKSIEQYEQNLYNVNTQLWVNRKVDNNIEEEIYNNIHSILFLIGESGMGKSTCAYKILKEYIVSGGYALWLPAELLTDCRSVESAIDKAVRELHPTIQLNAGKKALQLIQKNSRLLLIVDDINKSDKPTELLRKLIAWSKPKKSSDAEPALIPSYLFVCPVWPQIWSNISTDGKSARWVQGIIIGTLSQTEGERAVQITSTNAGISITSIEANTLAKKMGYDPFLINLFGALLSDTNQNRMNNLAEDATKEFIGITLEEIAQTSKFSFLATDYHEVLLELCCNMLKKRRLYPSFTEIKQWLDAPQKLDTLRELIAYGKICYLNNQNKLFFRHDRIQEALLVNSMSKIFTEETPPNDLLGEPFYAEIIGKALLHSPQNTAFLMNVRDLLPLALVEAIKGFGIPTSEYHKKITQITTEWAKDKVADGTVPDSVLNAVCWSLLETDSPVVLEITKYFPEHRLVFLVSLRNGCTKSGILYCIFQPDFAPNMTDSTRDQIIEHAKRKHGDKLVGELQEQMKISTTSDEKRIGALTLTGFLGDTQIQDEISAYWEHSKDKTQVLPAAIWAAARCCGKEPNKLLDSLINYWSGLSDSDDTLGMSPKKYIAESLRFALLRITNNDVINYFITQCGIHESLRWPITHMLELIDAPDSIEHIAKSAADTERQLAGTDGISLWLRSLTDAWDVSRHRGRRLSQASMDRLQTLWQGSENDDFVKKQAFRFWITGVQKEQLEILQKIPPNSCLFHNALWKRTQLGDQSVIVNLVPILSSDTYWFNIVHNVWCEEIKTSTGQHLKAFKHNIPKDFSGGRLDCHYHLSGCLMNIPTDDAEVLLAKYWMYLGYSPLFIQTALYVGTSKCLELAGSSISQCPTSIPVFRHLGSRFGFMDIEREKYLTEQHLDRLIPYLDRLGEHDRWKLAIICQRLGIPEWSQRHLSNHIDEKHRKEYHPTDEDLLKQLDESAAVRHGIWQVTHWLEKFDKRHDLKNRALSIVDQWLKCHPTIKGLKIAAKCVETIGTRKDLSILSKYSIEGPSDEIDKIKANANFSVYKRTLE